MRVPLGEQRRAYRLWFEYLKVARQSSDPRVKAALVGSRPFYIPWEMDKAKDFNSWWTTHARLFEEKYFVRELAAGEPPKDPDALIVEIPLTRSPTELMKSVRAIVQAAANARQTSNRKSKRVPTTYYRLTEDTEPKIDAIREMLSIYRDIYIKDRHLRGKALLTAVHRYYLGRKNKRWAKVPTPLLYEEGYDLDEARAMRNVRRYIQKAEKIVLNVARGQFPGKY